MTHCLCLLRNYLKFGVKKFERHVGVCVNSIATEKYRFLYTPQQDGVDLLDLMRKRLDGVKKKPKRDCKLREIDSFDALHCSNRPTMQNLGSSAWYFEQQNHRAIKNHDAAEFTVTVNFCSFDVITSIFADLT